MSTSTGDEVGSWTLWVTGVPVGSATWSSAELAWTWEVDRGEYGGAEAHHWEASWSGELRPDWSHIDALTAEATWWSSDDGWHGHALAWEDPACAWQLELEDLDGERWSIEVDQNDLAVTPASSQEDRLCARLDGTQMGEIERSTWELEHPPGGCGSHEDEHCPIDEPAGCSGATALVLCFLPVGWGLRRRRPFE